MNSRNLLTCFVLELTQKFVIASFLCLYLYLYQLTLSLYEYMQEKLKYGKDFDKVVWRLQKYVLLT